MKYITRKENFITILSFYNYILKYKEFTKYQIIQQFDVSEAKFKIMLAAIRSLLEIEYGYASISYVKALNKYYLVILKNMHLINFRCIFSEKKYLATIMIVNTLIANRNMV